LRQNIQLERVAAGGAAETGGVASTSGPLDSSAQSGFKMASLVAAGMLLSRIAGLVRESIFAHYFGNSDAADAFKAAFRIPNILQNLFGEGVLSASFIPVYSRLLGAGDEEQANVLAWTLGAILSLAISVLVLLGVAFAPYLIDAIAPGFEGSKRELTIGLVRIFFPGAGLLVMSAWCLGVLNSHHRFFASYTAPVAWNLAIIAFLLFYGPRHGQTRLAVLTAWGAVLGSALQVWVQLPQTMRLAGRLRVDFRRTLEALRAVLNNFLPVVTGRGVVQISAYIDNVLASLLPTGAVAALNYAQILYLLPVSLFGMSVAAAELPGMSRASGTPDEVARVLRGRLKVGLRQIAFFVIPSAAAFLFLGDVIAGAIFQSGHFTHADAIYLWGILAGSAVGLLAVTMGRLYSSAFYAMWDTRTPLKFAIIRVLLTVALGYYCALYLPRTLGIDRSWGVAGLTASAGLAGWVEFSLLRHALGRRIGKSGLDRTFLIELWAMALAACGAGYAIKLYLHGHGPKLVALGVVPAFAAIYFGLAFALGIPELNLLVARILPRLAAKRDSK
jgi:putative peptidoglycan lipid II flippase